MTEINFIDIWWQLDDQHISADLFTGDCISSTLQE